MPALDEVLAQKIEALEVRRGHRMLAESARGPGVEVVRGSSRYVSFSCNDYLGFARHPDVIAAAREALETYGAGAAASRLVTGNHPLYAELEELLARHKGTEAACVFGSGYLANIGVIPALMGKGDLIVADKLVHACMVDAARLSGAEFMRFAHNNLAHARLILEAQRAAHHHCLILTETVFSMDGDRSPVAALAALAQEFGAWLMTDDAHGLGLLAPADAGDIRMGTLSKAAGSYGGYVCGSRTLVNYLATAARSLVYSTALPPAVAAASRAALTLMMRSPELCEGPLRRAQLFTGLLGLPQAQSAVVPLVLRESDKALNASRILAEKGFLVAAIRPPTVPENTARLRFAFSALHEERHVRDVAAIVAQEGWV